MQTDPWSWPPVAQSAANSIIWRVQDGWLFHTRWRCALRSHLWAFYVYQHRSILTGLLVWEVQWYIRQEKYDPCVVWILHYWLCCLVSDLLYARKLCDGGRLEREIWKVNGWFFIADRGNHSSKLFLGEFWLALEERGYVALFLLWLQVRVKTPSILLRDWHPQTWYQFERSPHGEAMPTSPQHLVEVWEDQLAATWRIRWAGECLWLWSQRTRELRSSWRKLQVFPRAVSSNYPCSSTGRLEAWHIIERRRACKIAYLESKTHRFPRRHAPVCLHRLRTSGSRYGWAENAVDRSDRTGSILSSDGELEFVRARGGVLRKRTYIPSQAVAEQRCDHFVH